MLNEEKTMEMQWFCVEQSPEQRMPKWMRSVAVGDDGVIFAPAAMSGNEQRALLCASWDGVPDGEPATINGTTTPMPDGFYVCELGDDNFITEPLVVGMLSKALTPPPQRLSVRPGKCWRTWIRPSGPSNAQA
jgi:hypothetical protein